MNGSRSQIVLERDGKRYLIDVQSQTIREFVPAEIASAQTPTAPAQTATTPPPAKAEPKKESDTYYTEDIVLWNLPTAHHLPKKALMIDFTHRFNSPRRSSRVAFPISSGWIASPIHRLALLTELPTSSSRGFIARQPLSEESFNFQRVFNSRARTWAIRFQARFGSASKEPITSEINTSRVWRSHSLEVLRIVLRSISPQRCPLITARCRWLATTFLTRRRSMEKPRSAVGAGISVDIRPTVAIVGEAIYRVSERLGEHRPSFMLGIQKKVFRHSFTLGLSNSPGTTLSTRSATRGAYGLDDTFGGLTIGFNISRRLF